MISISRINTFDRLTTMIGNPNKTNNKKCDLTRYYICLIEQIENKRIGHLCISH